MEDKSTTGTASRGAIPLGRRMAAELIGTLLLVYFGAGAAAITFILANGITGVGQIGALGGLADWFAIGISFAIAIAVGIYAFGRVSGAHFNPAVTIALWSTKRFPSKDVVPYLVAQLIGAAIASLLFFLTVGTSAVTIGALGATAPFPGVGYGSAMLCEAIGTFVLMLAVMGLAVDKKAPAGWAGLIIGLSVGGVITATGNIAGASLNPARTFGPYLWDSLLGGPNLWIYFPIYIIGPLVGAIAAAYVWGYTSGE